MVRPVLAACEGSGLDCSTKGRQTQMPEGLVIKEEIIPINIPAGVADGMQLSLSRQRK